MNKERMLKLADFLEKEVPDERFDMSIYGVSNDEIWDGHNFRLESCGTAACVAGWTIYLFKDKIQEHSNDVCLAMPHYIAQAILDLSDDESNTLFRYEGRLRQTPRREIVGEIRKMIEEHDASVSV